MPGRSRGGRPRRRRRRRAVRLPDEAILIRFSQSDPDHVKAQIESCFEISEARSPGHGFYGLSFVLVRPGEKVDEVCKEVRWANDWMRLVAVSKLREAAYDPHQHGRDPRHVRLKWEEMPSDEEIGRLVNLFGEIEENPYPAGT